MNNESWLEDFYKFAESNIRGYKRPTDYKERLARLETKIPKPARESVRGNGYEHIQSKDNG